MKWTEAEVIERLREAYLVSEDTRITKAVMDEWSLLDHVPLRMPDGTNERIIDVLAVRCWSGGKQGNERIAFEVKVSRSDYRNETPEKRAPAEVSAHRCVYVVPAGLIQPAELPPGWGLVEVYENRTDRPPTSRPLGGRALWRKYADRRDPTCDLDYLVAAGFRRASRAEQAIREGEIPAAEVARLRHENDSMHGIISRTKATQRREEHRAKAARSELIAVLDGDQTCADCPGRLTWQRGGAQDSQWVHIDKSHEDSCRAVRAEADRRRKEAETGSKYSWGFAPPPEPRVLRERRLAEQEMETAS